ncbi:MAG TPA: hypothetical protein V6C86_22940 [Oculatellaceae cyanobacterium]
MKSVYVGIPLAIALSLTLAPRVCSYDVIYHQDKEDLTVDQKFALLPVFERKVLSKIALSIGKMAIPANSVLTVTIDQHGKVIAATSQTSREKVLEKLRSLSFGPIPCVVGTRTLLLTFKRSELGKTLERVNVQITAGEKR